MSLPRSTLLSLPAGVRSLLYRQHVSAAQTTTTLPRNHPIPTHRAYATESASPNSSVSPSEVSHFNALASSWWDPHGSSRLLHLMNPHRHDFIRACHATFPSPNPTPTPQQPLHYLDIGCGAGIFAESAARLPTTASVTAIDPTPAVIAVARAHARQDPTLTQPGRLTYRQTALEDLPVHPDPQRRYDVISVFEVLEHVARPTPFLADVLQHLKPGGWLVGSTIARSASSWVTTKLMAEEVLRVVPRGTHEWGQYIQPGELAEWARVQRGLEGWWTRGVVYVPGLGWRVVEGSEGWGNYFFGVRKAME